MEFKKILITGGAGFIGSNLIRKILQTTDHIVYNLDKLGYSSDLRSINNLKKSKNKHFHLNVDIRDKNKVDEAIKYSSPDIIFHLAAESHVDRSIDSPKGFIESNILGSFNLLESFREYFSTLSTDKKNKFRFLYISTDEVFGSTNDKDGFNENSAYRPSSPYSASKASSDHLFNAWYKTFNLPIITTNCSNNYGPYQFPEKLIPLTILKALNNENIPLYGNGLNIRDWLHVSDHVDALLLIAEKASLGERYCIGGNCERTNKDIVTTICKFLDEYCPKKNSYLEKIIYVRDRPGHDKRYFINTTKIKTKLGWEQKYDFDIGLKETIKWYLDNIEWCEYILSKGSYKGERMG